MKIESNHDNVEYKLTHLVNLVDEVCKNHGYVDESEHASMLLALDRDMIQVARNMEEVRQNLYKFLFDPYKIDYDEWRVTMDKKITCLENLLNATLLEDEGAILKTPDDIVKDEDKRYKDITYTRAYDTEVSSRVRISLIRSRVNIYKDIINGLRAISDTLTGINNDKETLLSNYQIRKKHFKALHDSFLVSDAWKQVLTTFKRKVNHYVKPYEDKSEGYQSFLEEYEELYGNDIRTDLCEAYLNNYDVSAFIIKYRDEIGIADIHCLFGYMLTHQMLQMKVQSFDVLKAPDAAYKKLFINRGAQELIERLVPLLAEKVDFKFQYTYSALYLAIQDLGLMPNVESNAPPFVKFVNKHFNAQIKANDSITDTTGLLCRHNYGKIAQGNYKGTKLNDKQFDAIRDEYHLCLTIVNKIMKINLAEEGFAEDVWKEHQNSPSFIEYENPERLILLRDILQGKHTEI